MKPVASSDTNCPFSSVVPYLYQFCGQKPSYKLVLKELKQREHEFRGDPTSGLSLQDVITQLLQAKISAEASAEKNSTGVLALLQLCLELGSAACCQDVFASLVKKYPLTAANTTSILFPVLKGLPALLNKHNITPDTQPFKGYIRDVFVVWTRDVLGIRPAEVSNQVKPVHADILRCPGCNECRQLASFLESALITFSLRSIGAPKVRHVEDRLAKCYGPELMTWSTITTMPRGITVRSHLRLHRRTEPIMACTSDDKNGNREPHLDQLDGPKE